MISPPNASHEFPVGLSNFVHLPATPPKKDHADFLNITGLRSDPVIKEKKCTIKVQAEQIKARTYPDCVCLIKEVKAHTPFVMKNVLDLPQARKSVIIDIKRWRWKCKSKSCGKTVTQPLDIMTADHYRMTRRLLEYCEVQALLGTALSLADETGISPRTIRSIRKKKVEQLKREIQFTAPRVLGLDGVRADGKRRRVIFTDIEGRQVLDLIESGSKKSIVARIRQFPNYKSIGRVTIDMCITLRGAVQEALPNAVIIVDAYHIIKTANESMDKVRIRLFPGQKKNREPGCPTRPRPEPFRKRYIKPPRKDKKKYEQFLKDEEYRQFWFDQEPELELAYELKEGFLKMFDHRKTSSGKVLMSSLEAKNFYQEWVSSLPVEEKYKDLLTDFKPILSPMKNWGEFVFNRFDQDFTNTYTESMNRKIKDILRESRGCKFETLHAKIVYGTRLQKQINEDRLTEMSDFRPRSKRPHLIGVKSQCVGTSEAPESGQSKAYELPDIGQRAFKFTN